MKPILPTLLITLTLVSTISGARAQTVTRSGNKEPAPAPLEWQAAAVAVKITPEKPMWMAGYASRNKPSEGVAQDLFAKTLVLEDAGKNRLAIVTLDLIGVPRTVRLNVAARVEKEHGIQPSHLLLNASHTHCGPELRVSRIPSDDSAHLAGESEEFTKKLEDRLVESIGKAIRDLAPASLAYGHARCGFAMNRRTPSLGGYKNFPNPDGPVDHNVPVLRVADAANKEIAVLFGYNCHNTTLSFFQFCGDYAGYAQQYFEETHPGTVAMFVNGCSGDQNPYPRGTLELCQTHGRTLATAVDAALGANLRPITGSIGAAWKEIPLPYDKPPSREELLELQKSGPTKYDTAYATRLLKMLDRDGAFPANYPYPVQVMRIGGDLTMVTLGGEVVIDYSHRLKREIKDPIVWIAGYSNDVMAYIPSQRVWDEGGYEGGGAMRYGSHPSRWASGVEEQIMSAVHELRASLP